MSSAAGRNGASRPFSSLSSPAGEGVLSLLVAVDTLGTGWSVSGLLVVGGELTVFEGVFDLRW